MLHINHYLNIPPDARRTFPTDLLGNKAKPGRFPSPYPHKENHL